MTVDRPAEQIGPLVDQLFRRESGRMTAWLMRSLGPGQSELAEDAVQEALISALKAWPYRGVPDEPSRWLWRVARNAATDRLRKTSRETLPDSFPDIPDLAPDSGGEDDELLLLFLCADPAFAPETAVPLTLKLACGFGDTEIAGALSIDVATVRQRVVRAKRRWRDSAPLVDLTRADMNARCGSVMNAIYLMLNEGYGGHHPEHWQRSELCREAARLAVLLAEHRNIDRREADALAALCLFQAARTPGRTDAAGSPLLTDDQDRSRWNRTLIAKGFGLLKRAGTGDEISPYHLLAGIASCHVIAPSYADTDWARVRSFYDQLVELDPASPFHRLNRVIALVESGDADAAMDELAGLRDDRNLARSYLLPATRAWVLSRLDQVPEARRELMIAVDRAPSDQTRRHLRQRLEQL